VWQAVGIASPGQTRLCLYCGSNAGTHPAYADAARHLGTSLANREIGLVYGGGSVGLMGIAADAALAAGGIVIGVITEQLVNAEVAHRSLTELEVVGSMHERKARMSELADGFIVLPGGFGTVDEFAEMLTWNQLGITSKPVVLLDVEGFWDPLLTWMDGAVEGGFVRPAHRMLAQRARTVDEAIALATSPGPDVPHKWIDRDGTPHSGVTGQIPIVRR
jgi:uncharacterized protein (TIGR00730 family)